MMYDIAPSFWKQQVGDLKISFPQQNKKSGSWSENLLRFFP